jgi:hypothetical protein
VAEGDQKTSEDLAVVLNELANRMERLKQLYEQYFMGLERLEPMVARKDVTRTMLTLQQTYIRNTGLRFKFNTMLQRWNIYVTYWNRTLREIENGTYVRHIQKAQRKAEREGRTLPSEMRVRALSAASHEGAPLPPPADKPAPPPLRPPGAVAARPGGPPALPGAAGRVPAPPVGEKLPSIKLETPPLGVPVSATPPQGTPRAPTPSVPGMSEAELRALHKKYTDARAQVGEKAAVRYETLVASLVKQMPKVLEQPGARGVRFDVSVVNGKAVLKATPTK